MEGNMSDTIIAYKGFDKNLRCRGFQYEICGEYNEPRAEACECGFHACEDPLDCISYYAPNESRYCRVELSGELHRKGDDSKVAATHIKILEEIDIRVMTELAVQSRLHAAIEDKKSFVRVEINLLVCFGQCPKPVFVDQNGDGMVFFGHFAKPADDCSARFKRNGVFGRFAAEEDGYFFRFHVTHPDFCCYFIVLRLLISIDNRAGKKYYGDII